MGFKPGNTYGKGRPVGSSNKAIAFNAVFEIMEKYEDKFLEALEKDAKKDILGFYSKYVQPIQPKANDVIAKEESWEGKEIICSWGDGTKD